MPFAKYVLCLTGRLFSFHLLKTPLLAIDDRHATPELRTNCSSFSLDEEPTEGKRRQGRRRTEGVSLSWHLKHHLYTTVVFETSLILEIPSELGTCTSLLL